MQLGYMFWVSEDRIPKQMLEARARKKKKIQDRMHGTNHGKIQEKSARNEENGKGQGQVQKMAKHT